MREKKNVKKTTTIRKKNNKKCSQLFQDFAENVVLFL